MGCWQWVSSGGGVEARDWRLNFDAWHLFVLCWLLPLFWQLVMLLAHLLLHLTLMFFWGKPFIIELRFIVTIIIEGNIETV